MGFQIIGITALILSNVTLSVKFQNTIRHIIKEIAVMGNSHHNAYK